MKLTKKDEEKIIRTIQKHLDSGRRGKINYVIELQKSSVNREGHLTSNEITIALERPIAKTYMHDKDGKKTLLERRRI